MHASSGHLANYLRIMRVLLLIPFALFVVLGVRALRPLVLIRFGAIPSHDINPFAMEVELFLCERDAGMHGRKATDFFYYSGRIVNQYLKKMWGRVLHVSQFAKLLYEINRKLPKGGAHNVPWRRIGSLDIHGLMKDTKPHLDFTCQEERMGQESLRNFGVSDGAPFVCFHARDPSYVASEMPEVDQTYAAYHDCNIHNFLPAMESLAGQGIFALRMGAIVQEPIIDTNKMVIDYATKGRSEFLDIYLTGKCRFYVGCDSGLIGLPMIFRRPIVITNSIPIQLIPAWDPDYLFIPKKLWCPREQRILTFREMLGLVSEDERWGVVYAEHGIQPIENTPDDIKAVVREMNDRLNGTWQTTQEDADLQREFWSLFKPTVYNPSFAGRIGAEFLRQNLELLE